MVMASLVPRYTAAAVRRFPDDGLRYEVIRGELFVSPAPGTPHQRLVIELAARLREYVNQHELGEVLPGPFEIEFARDTAVQPDILVLLPERRAQLTAKRLYGAPSLAVEIVSYSSKRTDRLQKRELYQVEGVDEYWVVDPDLRRVERWRPGAATPELLTDRLEWAPRAGVATLVIDLGDLFGRAWAGLEPDRRSRRRR
jgi:Uma2 family endonuclease